MDWAGFEAFGGKKAVCLRVMALFQPRMKFLKTEGNMFFVISGVVRRVYGKEENFLQRTSMDFIKAHPTSNVEMKPLKAEVKALWRAYVNRLPKTGTSAN